MQFGYDQHGGLSAKRRYFGQPKRTERIGPLRGVFLGGLISLLIACNTRSTPTSRSPAAEDATPKAESFPAASGTVVAQLDNHTASMLQAKDGTYWFASRDHGVCRFDGQRIVRYTAEDGLGGNNIYGLQEDRARGGAIIVLSGPGVLSRFDGHAFTKIPTLDASKSEWRLDPDDLWFPAGQDTAAVYRYDGQNVHLLKFPPVKAGDGHYIALPRDKFPNAKYTPYDVYTIFKDSRGHQWFGTATLGVCRYDGKTLSWAHKTDIGFEPDDAFGMRGIIEDKDGRFWFTRTGDRWVVEPDAAPGTPGTEPAPALPNAPPVGTLRIKKEPGIGPNDPIVFFMAASKDKHDHLWFGVMGGAVCRYDGQAVTRYLVTNDMGKPIWIYSTYQDPQGGLWVCTQGNGVYKFNGRTFERFKP